MKKRTYQYACETLGECLCSGSDDDCQCQCQSKAERETRCTICDAVMLEFSADDHRVARPIE